MAACSSADGPSISGKDLHDHHLRAPAWRASSWPSSVALTLTVLDTGRVAGPPGRPPAEGASTASSAQHLTNHHTHMETWIVGYFPYQRRVRIHHHCGRSGSTVCGSPPSTAPRAAAGVRPSTGGCGRPTSPDARYATPLARPRCRARGDLCIQGTTAAPPRGTGSRASSTTASTISSASSWTRAARGALAGVAAWSSTEPLGAHPLRGRRAHRRSGRLGLRRVRPGSPSGALGGCMVGVGASGLHTVRRWSTS